MVQNGCYEEQYYSKTSDRTLYSPRSEILDGEKADYIRGILSYQGAASRIAVGIRDVRAN